MPGVEHRAHTASAEKLGDEKRNVVVTPVVDAEHVRVVQGGGRLGSCLEPTQELGVVGQTIVKDLHRHLTTERHVVGEVHPSGRTGTDRRHDSVPTSKDTADITFERDDRHIDTLILDRRPMVAPPCRRGVPTATPPGIGLRAEI